MAAPRHVHGKDHKADFNGNAAFPDYTDRVTGKWRSNVCFGRILLGPRLPVRFWPKADMTYQDNGGLLPCRRASAASPKLTTQKSE